MIINIKELAMTLKSYGLHLGSKTTSVLWLRALLILRAGIKCDIPTFSSSGSNKISSQLVQVRPKHPMIKDSALSFLIPVDLTFHQGWIN